MASKFAKQYQIPSEFPDILKDFAREVLRNQPQNINEFAAKYFDCLASGLPTDANDGQDGEGDADMPLDEIENIVQDLFAKYDKDNNGYLDPPEFKALMSDLQAKLDFPPDEVYRFLAEADMNHDGMIEYEEFIPLALQIIQGMYAKKRWEQHEADMDKHAEEILVHGMTKEELTGLVSSIFEKIDTDGSTMLSKQEFLKALTSMELGLTRREINTIMFQIDVDKDGNISYMEFVPFAFDLLQKLTSMRLLETELENDELAHYLIEVFKAKDTEMLSSLSVDEVRDLLHEAHLGLSRMQIYTVLSVAEADPDGRIAYSSFIPRAVGLIRSMLSFEKSIARDAPDAGTEAEEHFYFLMDENFPGAEQVPLDDFMVRLEQCNILSEAEIKATKNLLLAYEKGVPVEEAKPQIWSLVKSMRRHCVQ